jgi:hypothetical protein
MDLFGPVPVQIRLQDWANSYLHHALVRTSESLHTQQVRYSSGSDDIRSTGHGLGLRLCTGTFGLLGGTVLRHFGYVALSLSPAARALMFHVGQVSGQRCSQPWEYVYNIPFIFPYSVLYVSLTKSHFRFGRVCRATHGP